VRLDCPSKNPRRPIASWVWRSHLVVRPPRGLQAPGANRIPVCESFLGLCPRFRVFPGGPRHRPPVSAALSRFSSPPAQPNRDEPPLPELPPPGPVSSLPFLPASTPCSRRDLPGLFHPGALVGFSLQSLTRQGSLPPSGAASPPAIGDAVSRYRTALPFGGFRLPGPRLPPSPFGFSALRVVVGSPCGGPDEPDRGRPVGAHRRVPDSGSGAASLQGFDPPVALGGRLCISAGLRPPGSPGLLPPWGFPLPGLGLIGCRPHRAPFGVGLAASPGSLLRQRVCARTRSSPVRPPPRYFRQVPFRVCYPVLQSFKEPGNRLASFEVAGPYEVFVLVPSVIPVSRACATGVGPAVRIPRFQVQFPCYDRVVSRSMDLAWTFLFRLCFQWVMELSPRGRKRIPQLFDRPGNEAPQGRAATHPRGTACNAGLPVSDKRGA